MVDGQSFRQQGLCITLTLVLFLRGYQGFFIKHSSGLCLQPASTYSVANKGKQTGRIDHQWGPIYIVLFQNTCRHSDAQFYFHKTYSVLYNIGKDGTFLARESQKNRDKYKHQFLIYHSTQPKTFKLYILLNKFVLKQTSAGALKLNTGYCPTSINYYTNKPSSPLIGSAVYQTKNCDKEEEKFMFGEVTKEGENMINVSCSPAQVMKVVMAEYGGFSNGKTFVHKNDADCSLPSACIVKNQCDGKTSCNMNVDSSLFKKDPCQGKTKELHMEYVCVDSLTKPITTVSKVRLSAELPNQGFVEILNGKTWRKVDDKNWDKRKHAALCRHLGYNDSKSVNNTKEINAGQMIASGDLYCSGIQPSNQSCCAYLYPSTSTQKTKIPYVTCTICDEPLLQNSTRFPDHIFSASVGNGREARLSGDGWCPGKSGAQYLQIDLQKDYFISYIATFGDKAQTKWTASYQLQYSSTHRELGSSANKMIVANRDAYGGSITTLNIAYARFLRITVLHGEDVCIRIQLCGDVLLSGPVKSITVESITAKAADIHWTLPENEGHNGITYFLLSLNDTSKSTENATGRNNKQYTFNDLKPYTNYKVTIQAGNAYGVGDLAYKTFMTGEAAPSSSPLRVICNATSTTSLGVSWEPPKKSDWNGIVSKYNVCYVTNGPKNCIPIVSATSYVIKGLKPATKYFVSVAAGTKAGYGVFSTQITKITNQERVTPVKNTSYSLSLSLKQPPTSDVTSILVIVQTASSQIKTSDAYQPNELKPYSPGSSDPYVAVGFSKTELPNTFVIGDGKSDKMSGTTYVNQPLKENTEYKVFVRFIETKDIYYSTVWSQSVKTYERPAAPNNLKAVSLSYNSLNVSWEKPMHGANGTIKSFDVCYEYSNMQNRICQTSDASSRSSKIDGLKPSTIYEIFISLETIIGYSVYQNVSKITNDKAVEISEYTSHGFHIKLPVSKHSVKNIYIIVKAGKNSQLLPDEYISNDLKSCNKSNTLNIYVTAVLKNVEDFSQTFEVGSGTWYNSTGCQYYNKPLERNKTYLVFARLFSDNKYYSTDWTNPITISARPTDGNEDNKLSGDDGDGNVALGIGITVPLVIILALVILAFIFWRRRSSDKPDREVVYDNAEMDVNSFANDLDHNDGDIDTQHDEGIYSNETGILINQAHSPVPISEFSHYVNEMKANDESAFEKEYDELPTTMEACWDAAKKPINKKKNRYGNIVTYDHSRVVLSAGGDDDYINASFIDGTKPNAYIACQGPTEATLNDMWKMIWEQRCYSIVMVTSLSEMGKKKCEKYWPDEGSKMFEDIQVTLAKTEEFAYYVVHTLQIKKGDDEREVKHYYFSSWPDHGVPKYPTKLLAFRKFIRTNHFELSGPIIIHCSAGVGRTGVFLAIDITLQKLEKGLANTVDVFGQVVEMRGKRMNMIQTLEQYIFVHEAILETILCGTNEVNSTNIKQEIKKLSEVRAGGMTGFEEKFKRLGDISPKFSDEECTASLLEGNQTKNRSKSIHPAECCRVCLRYIDGVENSDYINAVFVHGYLGTNYFIATQSPLPNTVDDFWRMVHEQNSSAIVLLNNVKDGTSFPKFWCSTRAQPKRYGKLTLQLDSAIEKDGIVTRKFIFSPHHDLHDGRVIKIFHCTMWPDHKTPDVNGVINLVSLVEKARQNAGKAPVIIACSNGAGRSGTYIAISNLLECMKFEQSVDIFQAVKIIRSSRPEFVENAEQFKFCYEVVSSYIDSFSEYANFD